MYTYKIMIHPNNKQATKIRQTMNKCIECNNIVYDYLAGFIKRKEKFPKCGDVRKWFTLKKKEIDNKVIEERKGLTNKEIREKHLNVLFYDVSNDALKQTIKDLYDSFIRFFKKVGKFPNKKEYKDNHKSFYVDPYKIKFSNSKVRLEKITNSKKANRQVINYISLAERDRIPTKCKYYNPRVTYYKNRFYITVGVDDEYAPAKKEITLTENVIGIDFNINEMVTSDNDHFKSATKSNKYRNVRKKLKRESRKLSRKYENTKTLKKKLRDSRNYIKQRKIRSKYIDRMNNLKESHDEEIIESLIRRKPRKICIEDLDIKSMQEKSKNDNKYIRQGIQNNGWRKFIVKLKDKCDKYGIELYKIDRWYPSSKKCHNCGNINNKLKLSDRIYKCLCCGLEINRDYNAALNIRDYKETV